MDKLRSAPKYRNIDLNHRDDIFAFAWQLAEAHQLQLAIDPEVEIRSNIFQLEIIVKHDPSIEQETHTLYFKILHQIIDKLEERENTPDAVEARRKSEENRLLMQERVNTLVENLNSLDFSNYDSIFDWIRQFATPSDTRGVTYNRNKVLAIFSLNGLSNNIYSEIIEMNDPTSCARQIIRMALEDINKHGSPHVLTLRHIDEWQEKFGSKTATAQRQIEKLRKGFLS